MHRKQIFCFSQENEKRIQEINKTLEMLPPGKLICARNGNSYKYYERVEDETHYLSKEKREHACQLAQRRILENEYKYLEKEQKLFNQYLKKTASLEMKFEECLGAESPMRKLLGAAALSNNEKIREWLNVNNPGNPYKPEELIHQTVAGFPVRSKSESMIITELVHLGVPFRYEFPLEVDGKTYYPDITLLHPISLQEWYLEHLGLMDSPTYAAHAGRKIADYAAVGILPSVNLLLTSETADHPLTQVQIINTLNYFLTSVT